MNIEIVYALPNEQLVHELDLPDGAVVRDAVLASRLTEKFRELKVDETPVGIYGVRVSYDDKLQHGDRVELYRPLLIDPMNARRARAKAQQNKRTGTED